MERERRRFVLWAVGAFVAGFLLRAWFIRHQPRIAGDSLVYADIARTWLRHGIYGFAIDDARPGMPVAHPTLIRLPGYPIFLAACFRVFGDSRWRAVMYLQAVADLVTCWLAAALAGRLFGSRAVLPVVWLAALCPFTACYTAAPLTETLSLTCIALAFYALARWQAAGLGCNRWIWTIAGALSYAILLRPEQGLLAASVVPAMLWLSLAGSRESRPTQMLRRAAPVIAASFVVLLPLVPWTIRNARTFHVFQPLAPRSASDPGYFVPTGFGRWYRTWAIDFASTEPVYWNYNGDPIFLQDLPTRAFDVSPFSSAISKDLYTRTAALLNDYDPTTTATPEIDARFEALAEQRIRAAPIRFYIVLPILRTLDMCFRPRVEMMPIPLEWWKPRGHPGVTLFAAAYALLNLGYFVLAYTGLRRWRRLAGGLPPIAWAMIASILLRGALLLTLDNSEPRYTLEFFPVLFVWCGACFSGRHQGPTGGPTHHDETVMNGARLPQVQRENRALNCTCPCT